MGLEELSRRMSKYYETHEMDIDYNPKTAKIPTFNQGSQSNNPSPVSHPGGNNAVSMASADLGAGRTSLPRAKTPVTSVGSQHQLVKQFVDGLGPNQVGKPQPLPYAHMVSSFMPQVGTTSANIKTDNRYLNNGLPLGVVDPVSAQTYKDKASTIQKQIDQHQTKLDPYKMVSSGMMNTITPQPAQTVPKGVSTLSLPVAPVAKPQSVYDQKLANLKGELAQAQNAGYMADYSQQWIALSQRPDAEAIKQNLARMATLKASFGTDYGQNVAAMNEYQRIRGSLDKLGINAEGLADWLQRNADYLEAAQEVKEAQKLATERPVLASVKSIGQNLVSGQGGLQGIAQQGMNTNSGEYRPINIYGDAFDASRAKTTIRGTVGENIAKNHGQAAKFLYDIGMSVGDSGVVALTGGLTGLGGAASIILGSAVASDTMMNVVERGGSTEQAVASGLLAGAAETIFESISLGKFLDKLKVGNAHGLKAHLKNALLQGWTEASEETATEIANLITDNVIMGSLSELNQMRAEGATEAQLLGEVMKRIGLAGLGGFLSGGVFGGVGSISNRTSTSLREQRALNALSEKTGVNIQVDDDIEGSNGYFDRKTNTLHISRNSNNAAYQVAAHEIAHSIESNPDEWNQLYEIANANLSEDARSKLEYVLQKTGYTDADMQSEVVSHYIQQCVTDIKSFEQLVGVNRTLAQRIVDAFDSFVRKLTGQRSIGNNSDTEYLREIMGDITPEQAQQTLAQMKKALAAGGQTTSVNNQNSLKLTDSDGNKLTEVQQEYFKDSKVRDQDGNLKVMYHGTPNGDYTVFKEGAYFSDNKAYADTYQNPGASSISTGKVANAPRTFAVYLNIKKPFDINDAEARSIYINDYIKGGNAMGINPYLSDAEYEKIQTIDWTEGEDLRDFLIENGYDYDGLVLDEGATGGYGDEVQSRGASYVVFSPEQVKNIDNENPTADKDIRYSRKLNQEALQEMVDRKRAGLPYAPGYVPKQQPQQLPYAPGYKAVNSPVQAVLPRAEELNRGQQKPAPMLNNQAVGIVASPELFEAMQSVVDYTTPKPNPEGSRSFDGSVLDNLGQGQAAFNTLDELLAQSKADAAKRPADKAGIANVLTERPKKGVKENLEIAADFAARKLIDSGHTIDTIAKAVDDKVLYPLYNNAKQSRQAAEYMIGDAQTDINGKRVGDSLVSIFDPIKSKGEDYFRDFSTYLYHVHNVDRMSLETNGAQVYQDAIMQIEMENPMLQNATREEVEALASGNSDYREAAIEWLQLDDSLNDLHNKPVFGESVTAEDSHKAATELLRKNPEFRELAEKVYAYNRNLMKYRVDAGLVSQKQADIMNALYPHYVPTFRDTSSTTGMKMGGNQAQVARTVRSATGSNLDLMPIDGSMAEQTLQTVRAAKMNIFGARLLEDALKHQDKVGRHIRSVVDKYNSYDMDEPPQYTGGITIYSGGKPVSMDADVGVMEAFKSIQPDPLEGSNIYRRIVEANNTFKALVTGANPIFLAKNFARDLQDAALYAGDLKDFAKNYPKAWKEIKNNGELWQLYKSQGGTGSSYFDYEKGLVDNKRKGVGKVFDKVEDLNMMVEQAPRFAEFMSVLEKEGRTYEGIQKAMLAAADVTVNFGRSGTLTKTLNKTFVPFLNPSIQGADKFIRRFAQTKGAKEWVDLIGRCALLGIAPALLNELLHAGTEEEEEYAMLNDRDKETNYVFRFDDGVWIKVPRGRALSVFGSAAQRTARMLKGEEDAWVGFIELALDQVGTTDPFTGHILSSYLNTELFNPESPGKTWYGGDIEPQRLQGLPPGERYDEKTDELSKWLGKQLNISPKKINHLLDSYTGVIGDIALPLMTPRAERNPFAAAFSIDSTTSNKLQGEFYDKLDELEQNKNSANPDAGTDLAYSYLNGVSREVSELNKQIRAIEANENIKDKDKRERTRKLADERNNLIKNALDVLPQYTEHAASYKGDPDDAKREVNRKQFGAEYALEKYNKEVYENAQKANKYLIPYETFYDVYFAQKDLKSDKDSDGKTIKNSLSKKKKAAIDKAAKSLTQKQKEYLYDMFGVSKSEWNKLPTKT